MFTEGMQILRSCHDIQLADHALFLYLFPSTPHKIKYKYKRSVARVEKFKSSALKDRFDDGVRPQYCYIFCATNKLSLTNQTKF